MRTETSYDEGYPTCSYTHAWLRVMSEDLDPEEITSMLGVDPTLSYRAGDLRTASPERRRKYSAWFISTEGVVHSFDSRHHLDWILEKVAGKGVKIDQLKEREYLVDVCVRWDSRSGHGGPTLSPNQLQGLGQLGLEVWFDIYFDDEGEGYA